MSAVKKQKPYQYPPRETAGQELLRQVKLDAERLQDKLQKSILDNPKLAKKSALVLSLWIAGKDKKRKT